MTDIQQHVPLKTIVAYVLDETQKSMSDFDRCWLLGLRALTDLTLDIAGQPLTLRLPVKGNKTVDFPPNCLSFVKAGVLNGSGEIETFLINRALTTYRADNPNRLPQLSADIPSDGASSGQLAYRNFHHDGGCYNLFGGPTGLVSHGECRVDEKHRVLILPPDFGYDSVLFEMIDCPEKNEDYQVLTCLQEAVIAFIKWKLKVGTMQEYYIAKGEGRRKLPNKRFILQSFNQVIRESSGMKLRS